MYICTPIGQLLGSVFAAVTNSAVLGKGVGEEPFFRRKRVFPKGLPGNN